MRAKREKLRRVGMELEPGHIVRKDDGEPCMYARLRGMGIVKERRDRKRMKEAKIRKYDPNAERELIAGRRET